METIFEFANDSLKDEVLQLFNKLTVKSSSSVKDNKRLQFLLKNFLYSIAQGDKKNIRQKIYR